MIRSSLRGEEPGVVGVVGIVGVRGNSGGLTGRLDTSWRMIDIQCVQYYCVCECIMSMVYLNTSFIDDLYLPSHDGIGKGR